MSVGHRRLVVDRLATTVGASLALEVVSSGQGWRVRTRTAVALVGGAVLLLAVPFAWVSWAFGGATGLLAFVGPLLLLVGLLAVVAGWARRPRRR